ncbi:flavin-containing monooxygenase FMO GS-OX-like 8 [Triticum aestivum]|uniref:flavin-containing monooxygenase FMO GS-OX-like 8 n=1 Tax=Triticum aestivum TaxID=4565 RepID=UPI001D034A5B|nr:flavin-containing monooxygenase FMO GS-OX-like 8 [Triticum aestivum]
MVCGESMPLERKKVCVIGAGMAGLASARELRREGHDVTVLEQNADVGGQWLYDPRGDGADDPLDAAGPVKVHGSLYASLRVISARENMGFTDFHFAPKDGRDGRRCPGHREVQLYLKDFCDAFGLMEAVRLNTRVLRVAMAVAPTRQWAVRSVHEGTEEEERRSSTPSSSPTATTRSRGCQASRAWRRGGGGRCTATRTGCRSRSGATWWWWWSGAGRATRTSPWRSADHDSERSTTKTPPQPRIRK